MSTNKKEKEKKPELHALQKFEIRRIHRKQIKAAGYNPRTIERANKQLLWSNLQKRGLLDTLVWNELTGNLVGGHRRLEKLDDHHYKRHNNLEYLLDVAVVQLSDQEEKEQNIFFNNPNAQGDWDRDLMIGLIPDIDVKAAGLTDADLNAIGIEIDLEGFENEDVESVISNFEDMKEQTRKQKQIEREANPDKKDWKAIKQDIKKSHESNNDERENYFVVTFDNADKKEAFLARFVLNPDERYIKGEVLTQIINRHLGE